MNKKVLTLCAGFLLAGSLTAFATDVTPDQFISAIGDGNVLTAAALQEKLGEEIEFDGTITLTGNVDLASLPTEAPKKYVVIKNDGKGGVEIVKITAKSTTANNLFKGHLVIAKEGLTVTGLDFRNKSVAEDANGYWTKTSITAFADNVTITNNKFKPEDAAEGTLPNGIVLYPQTANPSYNISGNTFTELNKTTSDNYYTSAIQIYQHAPGEEKENDPLADSGLKGTAKNLPSATLADPNAIVSALQEDNEFDKCYADIVVRDGNEWQNQAYFVQVAQITIDTESKDANLALKDAILNTDEDGTTAITLVGIGADDDIQALIEKAVGEDDKKMLHNTKAVVSTVAGTLVIGDVPESLIPSGNVTRISYNADGTVETTVQGATWGDYRAFDGKTQTFVMVTRSMAVYPVYEGKNVSYRLGAYDPSKDNAAEYMWTLVPAESSYGNYELRLQNSAGKYLVVNETYVTVEGVTVDLNDDNEWVINGQVMDGNNRVFPKELVLKAGSSYVTYNPGSEQFVTTDKEDAQAVGAATIGTAYLSANSLIGREGDNFRMKITYQNEKNKAIDITGEFKGQLRPVRAVHYSDGNTTYVDAKSEKQFMLVNEEGNIIAIDLDAPLHSSYMGFGYKFTTITPKEWDEALDNARLGKKANPYLTTFKFSYVPGTAQAEVKEIKNIEVCGWANDSYYNLWVGYQNDGEDATLVAAAPFYLKDVDITLNVSTVVDAKEWLTKPAYYTVEVINKTKTHTIGNHYGKVLGLDEDGNVAFVAPENIDLTKPEGQFAIDQYYTFTNRENGATSSNILNSGSFYQIDATTFAHVTSAGTDTLSIKPITDYKSYDGFKRYTADELNANTYYIAMNLLDDTYLNIVENHNDKHRIGLDREEATEWRIEMPSVLLQDAGEDAVRLVPDTVTVTTPITYYVGAPVNDWVETDAVDYEDDYYNPNTALKIPAYILKNTDTNEYLYGEDYAESTGNAYYVCNETEKLATRVAFKLIGGEKDSTMNIVPVYNNNKLYKNYSTTLATEKGAMYEGQLETYAKGLKLSNQKVIGGTTAKTGVLKDNALYEAIANDLFVVNKAAAPTYKKVDQASNIILSRVKNNDEVVYEAGEFAGISNRVAYDINPTLYVDSAYVDRAGNYAYQYLLMVQPSLSKSWYCPFNEEHNTEAWKEANGTDHCADAVRTDRIDGRFLVNMVDSAEANKDVHNNKYMYNDETKLAFVKGYHQNDTLYITNEADEVVSKIAVGNSDFNFAKFAFKMIDESDNEFVVETGLGYAEKYDRVFDNNRYYWKKVASKEVTPGYLRWVNGNLVVTSDIANAERFTMEDSELQATANESINANGAVSVTAVDGAVVIKGAAGKNVVIATILGKVVANETVNSDNETIAVPAGIAVVSVDGESFKVVVK